MKFKILAAVKFQNSNALEFAGLNDQGDNYNVHIGAGESFYSLPKSSVHIVKTYDQSNEIWDNEIEFAKEFGPEPQPPCARLGWIAPNGDFYPCAYVAHNDLAYKLTMKLYGEYNGSFYGAMEKRGWIAIMGGGIFTVKERSEGLYQYTAAQKETMLKITEAFEAVELENPDFDWTAELLKNPEGYSLQNWITSPTDNMYCKTFAKSLRECYEFYCGDYLDYMGVSEVIEPSFNLINRPDSHPGD